jgi:hypothetical protein
VFFLLAHNNNKTAAEAFMLFVAALPNEHCQMTNESTHHHQM